MSRFPGVDLLELDALLTEEERLVRDTVRAFVDDKVKPIIEECHREGRTPLELVPEMGALNLFGANLADYGLPGLGGVAYGLIMQELERGDSGLRSFASVQSGLVMYPIPKFRNLVFQVSYSYITDGRNVGQSSTFTTGLLYRFHFPGSPNNQ